MAYWKISAVRCGKSTIISSMLECWYIACIKVYNDQSLECTVNIRESSKRVGHMARQNNLCVSSLRQTWTPNPTAHQRKIWHRKNRKSWLPCFFLGGGSKSPKTLYHFNPFDELCQRRGWQKSLAPRERGWGHWSGDRWQGNGGIVSKSRLWVNRPDGYLNTMESFVAEDMPS